MREAERHAARRNWLRWQPVTKEDENRLSILAQYEQLKRWADTREQPIRNVRLLRSETRTEWKEF